MLVRACVYRFSSVLRHDTLFYASFGCVLHTVFQLFFDILFDSLKISFRIQTKNKNNSSSFNFISLSITVNPKTTLLYSEKKIPRHKISRILNTIIQSFFFLSSHHPH